MKKEDLVLGKRYQVIESRSYCDINEIVEYIKDDGSNMPRFRRKNRDLVYVPIDILEEIEETPLVIRKNIIPQILNLLGIKPNQKFKLVDGYTRKELGIFYFDKCGTLYKCYSDEWDDDYSAFSQSHYLQDILNGVHSLILKDS